MVIKTYISPKEKITLPKKIALETTFIPEIKSYFNQLRLDFIAIYAGTGFVLNMNDYSEQTISMLKKQYSRTAKVFKSDLRNSVLEKNAVKTVEETEEDNLINASIVAFIILNAKKTADFILNTNADNITKAVEKAKEILTLSGEELTNTNIAKKAGDILKGTFNGRVENIAITETQLGAEGSKSIEANVIAGEQPFSGFPVAPAIVGAVLLATKTWRSIFDEKTRKAHAQASGQTVKLLQPYIVAGEQLLYPRDTSLGATAKNIARCRCSSEKKIVKRFD